MYKESGDKKKLRYSNGVRIFISGLFLVSFFYGAFCLYSKKRTFLNIPVDYRFHDFK